jgi:hypothetical protein
VLYTIGKQVFKIQGFEQQQQTGAYYHECKTLPTRATEMYLNDEFQNDNYPLNSEIKYTFIVFYNIPRSRV